MPCPAPQGTPCRGLARRPLALRVVLCLVPIVVSGDLAAAPNAGPLVLDAEHARQLLETSGQSMLWPSIENDTSLLAFAMSEQTGLPSPRGARFDSIRVVSEDPHILVIDDFLSEEECRYLQAIGKPRLKPALVVKNGDQWFDSQAEVRNNEQIWLSAAEEQNVPLLRHIFKRIHRTVRVPDEFTEALQIGRYSVSQKYEGHVDTDPANGVGRPATFLIYLNDVEAGGHTLFPVGRDDCVAGWRTHPDTGEQLYGAAFCCDTPQMDKPQSVRVHPKRGRAVLFFNHRPTGVVDPLTKHIGCPVRKGEKWIAQRWLRHEPYNRISYTVGDGWDPRFDGAPTSEERPVGRHLRSVSHRDPRIYMMERFLGGEELATLMALAKGAPTVRQPFEEWHMVQPEHGFDPKLLAVLERVRLLALLPPGFPLGVRIMHWREGEAERPLLYTRHATVIRVFLASATRGGEVIFPRSGDAQQADYNCGGGMADCCMGAGLRVRGQPGDALIVYTGSMEGNVDTRTEHATCPVVAGDLWVAEFLYEFPINWPPRVSHHFHGARLTALFENARESDVWLFWVDVRTGSEVPMGPVPPGDTKSFNSYAGHQWHVRDREVSGELLLIIDISQEAHQKFVIGTDADDGDDSHLVPAREL